MMKARYQMAVLTLALSLPGLPATSAASDLGEEAAASCRSEAIDATPAEALDFLAEAKDPIPVSLPEVEWTSGGRVSSQVYAFEDSNYEEGPTYAKVTCTSSCTGSLCAPQGCDPAPKNNCTLCSCRGNGCSGCTCTKEISVGSSALR